MDDENAAPEEKPPMDPLMLEDAVRIRREYLYRFENATVVEAMLISPSHMQVSVCHLRTKANQQTGFVGVHKNAVCVPQAVDELEAFNTF